jgi:hypothetical protein
MYRESATTFAKSSACRTLLDKGEKNVGYEGARMRARSKTHSGICVREETRSPCRRSMSSGMNSCRMRASSRARRSAVRHFCERQNTKQKERSLGNRGDVLPGISVSGTSQSIVNNLSICSRALDTKPCTLPLKKRWGTINKKERAPRNP